MRQNRHSAGRSALLHSAAQSGALAARYRGRPRALLHRRVHFAELFHQFLGRRLGSRFVADICGAVKLFVKVAGTRSDAF